MFKKIYNFALEQRKWQKAGRPYRTDSQILQLYSICSGCEHFLSSGKCEYCGGNCQICGCRISPIKEIFNKLAWATTSCPLDDPKWKEEPEHTELNLILEQKELENANPPPPPPAPPAQRGCGCH